MGQNNPGVVGSTSSGLLASACSGDASAWERLVELYGPLVYHWCRSTGLQPADAADVVQDVFRTVATSLSGFQLDRSIGSFRGWLRVISHSKTVDFYRKNENQVAGLGGSTGQIRFQNIADDNFDCATDSSTEPPQFIQLHDALELLRSETQEHTWQAFWRTTVEEHSADEVARDLNMTRGAVFEAKSRTLKRLRKILGDEMKSL